jgi:putative peptidoglycan lipid II flippase
MVALLGIGARPMGDVAKFDAQFRRRIWRIVIASIAMGFVLWMLNASMQAFLGLPGWRYLALTLLVAAGIVSYDVFGQLLGAFKLRELRGSFKRG